MKRGLGIAEEEQMMKGRSISRFNPIMPDRASSIQNKWWKRQRLRGRCVLPDNHSFSSLSIQRYNTAWEISHF
jgi:hypothetical protein